MKRTMKKTRYSLMAALLAVLMMVLAVSCGVASTTSDDPELQTTFSEQDLGAYLSTFDRTTRIENTVLVNENGIKITATNSYFYLGSTWGRPDLFFRIDFKIENNTSGTIMCSPIPWIAVNGYSIMAYTGLTYDDVPAGRSEKGVMEISVSDLLAMGMTSFADIRMCIEVQDENYHALFAEEDLLLKTNKADSYKVEEDCFRNAIISEEATADRSYVVEWSKVGKVLDQNGISVLSQTLVSWSEGRVWLLEIANETDSLVYVAGSFHLNGMVLDYSVIMGNRYVYPHSVGVVAVEIGNATEDVLLEDIGISEMGKIGLTLTVQDADTLSDVVKDAYIEVVISENVPPYSLTETPYEQEDVKLYYLGYNFEWPSGFIFNSFVSNVVVENGSGTDVTLSLVSVEIDGVEYAPYFIFNAMTIKAGDGAYVFLCSEILPENFDASGIKSIKVNFSIEDDQGRVIATPSITLGE